MWRYILVILVLFSLVNASVIVLNDLNFEHDTQAATGATTGAWFVKFVSPDCGHSCDTLVSIWNELALELHGEINVASVNVQDASELQQRFALEDFPSLIIFHKGFMYTYVGEKSLDSLQAFARDLVFEGVITSQVQQQVRVPPPGSFNIQQTTTMVFGLENVSLMNPLYILGLIVLFFVYLAIRRPRSDKKSE